MMKSKLLLSEEVSNKDRKFGEALSYYPLKVVTADGETHFALLTQSQIEVALKRAETNNEDLPKKTFLESLFNK